jgi:hypothetical protein
VVEFHKKEVYGEVIVSTSGHVGGLRGKIPQGSSLRQGLNSGLRARTEGKSVGLI